jgi:hypothetical protein
MWDFTVLDQFGQSMQYASSPISGGVPQRWPSAHNPVISAFSRAWL